MKSEHLGHENLDVYKAAIDFLSFCAPVLLRFPKGYSDLYDQLRRASSSISLNIAEGAGKLTKADATKFYGIARGSTLECGAVLDNCHILGLLTRGELDEGKSLLIRIASMLTKMARPTPKNRDT